jgi:plasmid stabilization system protein ParE
MAKRKVRTIVWSRNVADKYYEILDFLEKKAPEALPIVGNALLDIIDSLTIRCNSHPADRYKKNNDGSYKAAIIYSYRISYQVKNTNINILRIRHTSREPLNY